MSIRTAQILTHSASAHTPSDAQTGFNHRSDNCEQANLTGNTHLSPLMDVFCTIAISIVPESSYILPVAIEISPVSLSIASISIAIVSESISFAFLSIAIVSVSLSFVPMSIAIVAVSYSILTVSISIVSVSIEMIHVSYSILPMSIATGCSSLSHVSVSIEIVQVLTAFGRKPDVLGPESFATVHKTVALVQILPAAVFTARKADVRRGSARLSAGAYQHKKQARGGIILPTVNVVPVFVCIDPSFGDGGTHAAGSGFNLPSAS